MLTIRMQRTGRKGLSQFRVVVQDSRFSPSSGHVVAQLGHYNPHTKETVLDKAVAEKYLANGAQPSPRVIRLLQEQKVKLPDWVDITASDKKRATKNPDKLRKNQPAQPEPVVEEVAPKAAPSETAENTEDTPSETPIEDISEDQAANEERTEETAEEKPADA